MPERNRPEKKTLESWKQIAAYLDRSERAVRRWEATEGLPVHRREHQKQDSVFAYKHEIEAWSRARTRCPGPALISGSNDDSEFKATANGYLREHDAITRTMHCYIAGARAGEGTLVRLAFHPSATISGYCQGVEYSRRKRPRFGRFHIASLERRLDDHAQALPLAQRGDVGRVILFQFPQLARSELAVEAG